MRRALAILALTLAGCTASVRPAKVPDAPETCSALCVFAWCTVNCPAPPPKDEKKGTPDGP